MLRALSPSHARGLLLLSGLVWLAALTIWLMDGPSSPASGQGWRVVGVKGRAARPGLYLLKQSQGLDVLARLAGFDSSLAAGSPSPENGFQADVTTAGTIWRPLPEGARLLAGLRLNPNLATAGDLTLLTGIGPGRAKAIINTRDRLGRFKDISDLSRVPGLGRERVRALSTEVEF